ncbi:hypothetical protein SUGI_0087480 [Cryptomeria japonica]|uniref:aldehyde oxidase GLOX n=1 Tax=Cryptomeria japonica TaxID=3369 RepID=UPI002408AA88|nr:aldehyde oxidase GLOX [Cryptomeria japonica]GLJ08374.1 hypothetical protein SUGI_0087480 [Cryptomeria japonica]
MEGPGNPLAMVVKVVAVLLVITSSCWGRKEKDLQGRWELLLENAGIAAMHTIVMHNNKVIMFDRPNHGSNITRTSPPCTNVRPPLPIDSDCWAHSIEYDIATNKVRPLHILTDTWCSSGALSSNGTLVQTGGWGPAGAFNVRYYTPCSDGTCDWVESVTEKMLGPRWYASDQILPDNRIIVVGGTDNQFNYEFVPKRSGEGLFDLPFLNQTNDFEQNNLYPFLHLSSDGNIFIFANRDSILLDYKNNKVIRTFPTMPGGGARNYPSTGSSVMLPLDFSNGFKTVEIMICGGAPVGSFSRSEANKKSNGQVYLEALKSCGRMEITSENPVWEMEDMPGPRVLNDMIILPTGEILIINGARNGSAGWQDARIPVLNPWLYRAENPAGKRFTVLAPSTIPRMYHSTANLLPDGRILAAGSNANDNYTFTDDVYSKTELRVDAYSPYYLDPVYNRIRPNITYVKPWAAIPYGSEFLVNFTVSGKLSSDVRFHVYAPPFTSHSWSMNQRMLSLAAASPIVKEKKSGKRFYWVVLTAPPSPVAAPSGFYMLTIVNGGVPSQAQWIHFG